MKRFVAAALILLMFAALFAGCGDADTRHRPKAGYESKVEYIAVYLDDSLDKSQALLIGEEILKIDHVEKAEFKDKDEALEVYREQLGDEVYQDMMGENNPLPYSYRVTVDREAGADEKLLNEVIEQLKQIELMIDGEAIGGVDSVSVRPVR